MERQVLKTQQQLQEWLNECKPVIAFDTETTSLRYSELQLVGFSICDGVRSCYVDYSLDNGTIIPLKEFLSSKCKTIIMHNANYDLKVLHKYNIPYTHLKLYCTMVAQHLLNESGPKGLKELSKTLLQKEVQDYVDASKLGIHSNTFYNYAINDAEWTWELCQYQQPLMKAQNLVSVFRDIEMPFQHCLVQMETQGISVDTELAEKTSEQLRDDLLKYEVDIHHTLGHPYQMQASLLDMRLKLISSLNLNSSQQVAKILYQDLKLPVLASNASGGPSTGKEAFEKLKGKHPVVDLLYKYKKTQKLLTAFFEPLPTFVDPDGKVRASFNDCGTVTGRLSCSDPNLQQLSRVKCHCGNEEIDLATDTCKSCKSQVINLRRCFKASPGYKMISADYSSQEVRVAAQYAKDPTLIDALVKGKDVHLTVANQFYNLGLKEEDLYENSPTFNTLKKKYKTERTAAKVITFGLLYGKGAYGLALDFGISEEEAQKLIDKYFAGMPHMKKAIDAAHESVKNNGYVVYLSGRRRRFTKVQNGDWEGYTKKDFRQSFNSMVQGFSADMVRMACIGIYKEAQAHPEWGLRLLATVHDEIIVEVKEMYAQHTANVIKTVMSQVVKFDMPITADVSIADNYGMCK